MKYKDNIRYFYPELGLDRLAKKHFNFLPDFIKEGLMCCPECGCGKEDESTINTEWYRCSNCGWKDNWGETISSEEWINKNRFEKLEDILK